MSSDNQEKKVNNNVNYVIKKPIRASGVRYKIGETVNKPKGFFKDLGIAPENYVRKSEYEKVHEPVEITKLHEIIKRFETVTADKSKEITEHKEIITKLREEIKGFKAQLMASEKSSTERLMDNNKLKNKVDKLTKKG